METYGMLRIPSYSYPGHEGKKLYTIFQFRSHIGSEIEINEKILTFSRRENVCGYKIIAHLI